MDLLSAQLSFLCFWMIFLIISVFRIVLFLVSSISWHKYWFFSWFLLLFSSSNLFFKYKTQHFRLSQHFRYTGWSSTVQEQSKLCCLHLSAYLEIPDDFLLTHFLPLSFFHLISWSFLAGDFWGYWVRLESCHLCFHCFYLFSAIDRVNRNIWVKYNQRIKWWLFDCNDFARYWSGLPFGDNILVAQANCDLLCHFEITGKRRIEHIFCLRNWGTFSNYYKSRSYHY